MTSPVAISEVTAGILKNPLPVLMLDTCSILDVIRAPARHQAEIVPFVQRIAANAVSTPAGCFLVSSSRIPDEFCENLCSAVIQLRKFLTSFDRSSRQIWAAHGSFESGEAAHPVSIAELNLAPRLKQLAESLLLASAIIEGTDDLKLRATLRAAACRPPARKGKIKDSIIIEEYLELSHRLTENGFSEPLVFLSSNTKDYCFGKKSNQLNEDLAKDFKDVGLQYCFHWAHAAQLIGV